MKQDLLTFTHWTQAGINDLLDSALDIKTHPGKYSSALAGKSVVGLFEKPSLRTRVSFDIGINKLGGHFLYLDMAGGNLAGRESGKDMAGNLGCWADAIVARVFKHSTLTTLADNTNVPVINALCDLYHPCQALADYLVLKEKFVDLTQAHLAFLGDGNNVCHSLMIVGAILGVNLTIATPSGYEPDDDIIQWCQHQAKTSGSTIVLTQDVSSLKDVDALYTDTWISMGDNTPLEEVKSQFQPFQLNSELMQSAGAKWAMHCQPAHRDLEITTEVVDGEQSLLLLQAENRMHAQNAILLWLLADK